MKKAILVVIGLFLFTSLTFACVGDKCITDSNVQDSNDGNKGYIFVYDCEKGNDSVGEWVDPTTIPTLKGDKGDKGDIGIGIQGLQGIKGDKGDTGIGIAGLNGIDGYTPIKGVDYFDGLNGEDGLDFDPAEIIRLDGRIDTETFDRIGGDNLLQDNINVVDTNSRNRDNVLQENINTETTGRINGDNFLNNRINDTNIVVDSHSKTLQDHENRISNLNGRVGDLEATQYNVEGVLRVLDTKKTTIEIYNTYDTAHSREVAVGVRVTYKLGKSYQDKVNEKTEVRLSNLEKQIGNSPIITKVVENGKTKSISISANGLAVSGDF